MAVAQIQIRRGTTAEWAAANPVVLAAGEQGYDTTLKRLKMGDGATEWASLPWLNGDSVVNVTNYGATGDGVTDDTTSIKAAVTAAAVEGGTVFFPAGRYKITDTLYMAEGVNFLGASTPGRMSSNDKGAIIDYYGAGTAVCVAESATVAVTCVSISNLRVNDAAGTGTTGVSVGTNVDGYGTDIKLDRIAVLGFARGFAFYKCYAIHAVLCIARRSVIGWYFPAAGSDSVDYGSLTASSFISCGGYGYASGTPGTFFTNAGWYILRNFSYSQLISCYWDGAVTGFKVASDGAPIVFSRCGVERFRDYGFWFGINTTSGNATLEECKIIKNSGTDFESIVNFIKFDGNILTLRNMYVGWVGDGSTKSLNITTGTAHLDNTTYGTLTGTVKNYTIV